MFMLSYGITQSIYSRWDARTISAFNRASGDYRLRRVTVQLDESMGFGQVTPLLLLILPLLAAAEIFYDARDEKAHDNDAIDDHRPDDTAATPPTRVDTGLVARSQEDQELEQAAKMYDDNLSLVRRYFDVEPVEIELRSGTALTAEDIRSIWLEKKKYYDPSQSLEDVHRKITPAFVWSTVLIACAVTVSAGVTLNYEGGITGDSYVFIVVPFAGIILLLCYFLVHLSRFISRFAEAWDSLRDEQTVARIWNLVQKDVTQVDGTSATSSPAITASSVTRLSDTPTPPPEDIALQTISTHSS